jgi:hypothetical protein
VMPAGMNTGTPLIQHGRHGQEDHHGVALVAECGQHFLRSSGELATEVTMRFLAHFGLVHADSEWAKPKSPRRYELMATPVIKTGQVKFARPVVGLETFSKGELIVTDGEEEVRAPCDDCTIFMPARVHVPGRELVYLTRPLA